MQKPPTECHLCPAGEVLSARMELSLTHLQKASGNMEQDLKALLSKLDILNAASIHLSEEVAAIRNDLKSFAEWQGYMNKQGRRLDEHIAVSESILKSHQARSAAFGAGGGFSMIGVFEFLKWLFFHLAGH